MRTAVGGVEIDLTDPRMSRVRDPRPRDAAARPGTTAVLLVEDDDGDALLVTELLDDVGDVELTRVTTFADARARVHDGCECVLLDLNLPDATGVTMVRQLIEDAPSVAVLVLTGLADEYGGVTAVAAGAQDYLVKGQVDGVLLERSIRYAIERKRAEENARALAATRLQAEENARLERGLIAQPLLHDVRLSCRTRYRPGREQAVLGGDFFDVVETPDGTLHLLIGDVCGHGTEEAALGVSLRIAWRALVLAGLPPQHALAALDQLLVTERRGDELFATVAVLSVAPDRRAGHLILAGHPAPLLLADGRATPLPAESATAIGVMPGLRWTPTTVDLGDAWSVLLYTDGLIEGRIGQGAVRLSEQGLIDLTNQHLPTLGTDTGLLDTLITSAETLNGGPLSDDVAMLLLRYEPVVGRRAAGVQGA